MVGRVGQREEKKGTTIGRFGGLGVDRRSVMEVGTAWSVAARAAAMTR